VDGDKRRHPPPGLELAPYQVAGALRGHHPDVEVGPRLDLAEVDVEAVGEGERRPLFEIRLDLLAVDLGLDLVGEEHHDDVGLGHRLGDGLHGKAPGPRLLKALRGGPKAHHHVYP